jgi:hypothetical protein
MPKESNKRRTTRARQQRRNEQTNAGNTGATSTENRRATEPTTGAATNYTALSTEVLQLLLAQRNLSLSGSMIICCNSSPITIPPKTRQFQDLLTPPLIMPLRNFPQNLSSR